jgi:hypothetical protein
MHRLLVFKAVVAAVFLPFKHISACRRVSALHFWVTGFVGDLYRCKVTGCVVMSGVLVSPATVACVSVGAASAARKSAQR